MSFIDDFFSKKMWDVRSYRPFVKKVAALEDDVKKLSDEDFPKETARLREEIKAGGNIQKILPYCFALAREASVRALGLRHFDVQIMGGAVLFEGK
ncbi:preprotein translocase subunit SecA, partial [bacterium]|nr:preprotein translocase subunit SecA [bacterium]